MESGAIGRIARRKLCPHPADGKIEMHTGHRRPLTALCPGGERWPCRRSGRL